MSIPPFLDLPPTLRAVRLTTPRGEFAALVATSDPSGDGDESGPEAVLVPGFTGSKEDFIAVLEPLAAAGYRTTAFDQRGQYETPGPAEESAYTLGDFADDLVAVVAARSRPVHVVGHSFGGLVVRAAAVRSPESFSSVTLLSSGPGALPPERSMLLPAFRASVQAHGLAATWTAMKALEAEQGVSEPDDPAVAAFMSNKFHANAPGSLLAMTAVLLAEPDSVADLAATGLPTLVAHGAADDGWPPDVQAEMARRLSATYVVWDGVGHSPAVDDPEMTASALTEFWQSVDGRDHIVK